MRAFVLVFCVIFGQFALAAGDVRTLFELREAAEHIIREQFKEPVTWYFPQLRQFTMLGQATDAALTKIERTYYRTVVRSASAVLSAPSERFLGNDQMVARLTRYSQILGRELIDPWVDSSERAARASVLTAVDLALVEVVGRGPESSASTDEVLDRAITVTRVALAAVSDGTLRADFKEAHHALVKAATIDQSRERFQFLLKARRRIDLAGTCAELLADTAPSADAT